MAGLLGAFPALLRASPPGRVGSPPPIAALVILTPSIPRWPAAARRDSRPGEFSRPPRTVPPPRVGRAPVPGVGATLAVGKTTSNPGRGMCRTGPAGRLIRLQACRPPQTRRFSLDIG